MLVYWRVAPTKRLASLEGRREFFHVKFSWRFLSSCFGPKYISAELWPPNLPVEKPKDIEILYFTKIEEGFFMEIWKDV